MSYDDVGRVVGAGWVIKRGAVRGHFGRVKVSPLSGSNANLSASTSAGRPRKGKFSLSPLDTDKKIVEIHKQLFEAAPCFCRKAEFGGHTKSRFQNRIFWSNTTDFKWLIGVARGVKH